MIYRALIYRNCKIYCNCKILYKDLAEFDVTSFIDVASKNVINDAQTSFKVNARETSVSLK